MSAAGLPAAVTTVATVTGGGIAVDGRFARDDATAQWRASAAPLALFPYALAAYRDADGAVRTIVSATPDATPLPEPVEPDDDDGNPSDGEGGGRHLPVPLAPAPLDAVVLRETADGWVDLDRASFQRSGGRDLPDMTVNTRAFVVDGDGTGFLLGGVTDTSTAQPYIGGDDAPTLGAVASVRRLEKGALAPQPPDEATQLAETPTPPGAVRLGFGGHAACLDRCGGAGGQGYAPDTHLQSAITRVREMVAGGAGPAALLIGGGRASVGGDPLDVGGARRYRALTEGGGVPTYVVPGPGDSPDGGADAFASAFASAPAPQGTGEAPTGVDLSTVAQPGSPVADRARSTFAFDVHAPAGTVRVIVIDNAAGKLEGGLDGPQAQWVRDALEQARGQGIPSVVVGSAPLDDTQSRQARRRTPPRSSRCSPAERRPTSRRPASTTRTTPTSAACWRRASPRRPARAAPLAAAAVLDARLRPGAELHQRPGRSRGGDPPVERRAADARRGGRSHRSRAPASPRSRPCPSRCWKGCRSTRPRARPARLGVAALRHGHRPEPAALPDDAEPRRAAAAREPGLVLRRADRPVPVLRHRVHDRRPVRHDVRVLEPADRALRRRPPRPRSQPRPPGGRHRRQRPRHRRPARLPLPARARNGRRHRHRPRPPHLGRGPRHPRPEARQRQHPLRADPRRHVRLPVLHPDRRPADSRPPPPSHPRPRPRRAAPAPSRCRRPSPHHAPGEATARPRPCPPRCPPCRCPHHPSHRPSRHPHRDAADPAHPPVAPAPKPPVPPAPPAPPQGLQVQQVQAQQLQPFQAMQQAEQRRDEYAYDTDSAAVAYAHPPSPFPWEIAGGVALLALVMAGGTVAGRARSRAPARADHLQTEPKGAAPSTKVEVLAARPSPPSAPTYAKRRPGVEPRAPTFPSTIAAWLLHGQSSGVAAQAGGDRVVDDVGARWPRGGSRLRTGSSEAVRPWNRWPEPLVALVEESARTSPCSRCMPQSEVGLRRLRAADGRGCPSGSSSGSASPTRRRPSPNRWR